MLQLSLTKKKIICTPLSMNNSNLLPVPCFSKYRKWYFNIIRQAKNRSTEEIKALADSGVVFEEHHIFPRSFASDKYDLQYLNRKENLVSLTAREHFVVHFLLMKYYKERYNYNHCNDNDKINGKVIKQQSKQRNSQKTIKERYKKMANAFFFMANITRKHSIYYKSKKKITGQIYQIIRASYATTVEAKYSYDKVKQMFDFYMENLCFFDVKQYKKLQKKFDYPSKRDSLLNLFKRNNLFIQNHSNYKIILEKRKSHLLLNKFDNKLLCNDVINYFLDQNKNNCLRDALNKTIKEFNLDIHYKTLQKHLVNKNVISLNKTSYKNEELETLYNNYKQFRFNNDFFGLSVSFEEFKSKNNYLNNENSLQKLFSNNGYSFKNEYQKYKQKRLSVMLIDYFEMRNNANLNNSNNYFTEFQAKYFCSFKEEYLLELFRKHCRKEYDSMKKKYLVEQNKKLKDNVKQMFHTYMEIFSYVDEKTGKIKFKRDVDDLYKEFQKKFDYSSSRKSLIGLFRFHGFVLSQSHS